MDFTPQVETREIADNELDGIAGGTAGVAANAAGYGAAVGVGDVAGTVESLASVVPASQLSGLATVQTSGI
ncbi:hypothetical protein [Streptomyces sp. 8N706]|uniref:hypothetical protein n=1 Tax=Streptomyces sp. 8N706 TaxID=3457416 RepID=UPI003FD38F35